MRHLLFLLLLVSGLSMQAQTKVHFRNIRVIEKGDTLHGPDVSFELGRAEGAERTVLYTGGDVLVKAWAKVSSHNVRRSSVKDSAVNLIMELDMHAGRDKDNKRLEKIFYLDQSRTSTVTQRFNFKDGITMRGITLSFQCGIE
ncbi:MAG TPA: hypothetical protein VGE21_04370 [Flavobacteriales bacterium]